MHEYALAQALVEQVERDAQARRWRNPCTMDYRVRPAHETRRTRVMKTDTEINQPDDPKDDIACHRRDSSRS
jgi:ribosomal protein S12 methylthiotransferase accessory factor YcaO